MDQKRARYAAIATVLLAAAMLATGCAHQRGGEHVATLSIKPCFKFLPMAAPRPARAPEPAAPEPAPEPTAPACAEPSGWPLDYAVPNVISTFGVRRASGGKGRLHRGIDIKGPYGSPIIASADGVVTLSGVQSGYGDIVVLKHSDSCSTAYAHLSARYVHEGDTVKKGEKIGALGRTGRASTPHLHYEVRLSGAAVNPASYLPK